MLAHTTPHSTHTHLTDLRTQAGRPSYVNMSEDDLRSLLLARGLSAANVKRVRLRESLWKKLEQLDDKRDGVLVQSSGVVLTPYQQMDVNDLCEQYLSRTGTSSRATKPALVRALLAYDVDHPRVRSAAAATAHTHPEPAGDLLALTIPVLRARLKKGGLTVRGNKAALVARLVANPSDD